jgi:hypothetical protein
MGEERERGERGRDHKRERGRETINGHKIIPI